jgi:hypothetical protein
MPLLFTGPHSQPGRLATDNAGTGTEKICTLCLRGQLVACDSGAKVWEPEALNFHTQVPGRRRGEGQPCAEGGASLHSQGPRAGRQRLQAPCSHRGRSKAGPEPQAWGEPSN